LTVTDNDDHEATIEAAAIEKAAFSSQGRGFLP